MLMFIMSTVGYWMFLIVHVSLTLMLLTNESKRLLHLDSRIEEVYFKKIIHDNTFAYTPFRNTVYIFLFFIALVPILNVAGAIWLAYLLIKRD